MVITSLSFAAFTLTVLLAYYLLPTHNQQNGLLLAASYLYLATWDVRCALIFGALSIVNFVCARQMTRIGSRKQYWLYAGIAVNVAALLYLKYADFFILQAVSRLETIGLHPTFDTLHIVLPVGLSFFVLQAISYLIDVAHSTVQPVPNFVQSSLYMSYFPRVTSGPIERARDFIPQLQKRRAAAQIETHRGLTLLLRGLLRKVVVADLLFLSIPQDVFHQPRNYSSLELALWLLAYAFALYNDFAGYSSIARAISIFLGLQLVENFNVPYRARNFTEFWQRWHISFSSWLRDYIFLPLTRTLLRHRRKLDFKVSLIVPPFVTMLVSAIWHDLSLNMLVWGVLHGTYLMSERLWVQSRPTRRADSVPAVQQFGSSMLVFTLVLLAWVPFHATLSVTLTYWAELLSPIRWLNTTELPFHPVIFLLISFSCLLDFQQSRSHELALQGRSVLVKALAINAAVFIIIAAAFGQMHAAPPFVYQGF